MHIFTQNVHTRIPYLQVPHAKSWLAGEQGIRDPPSVRNPAEFIQAGQGLALHLGILVECIWVRQAKMVLI